MLISEMRLDGNAAGGALRDVFALDVTAARATCAGCGDERPVGELLAYGHPVGVVLRCPGCSGVMLGLVRNRNRLTLDTSGIALLVIVEDDSTS